MKDPIFCELCGCMLIEKKGEKYCINLDCKNSENKKNKKKRKR